MKTKTLFIVNPISGIGRQKRIETLLSQNLNLDLFDYEVRYTERIHHGTELAREAAAKGYDCVVAVGGDGSVNDVVQGLRGSDTVLGIIPCGSGNGLAHTLKLPLQPWLAIRTLNQQYEVTIDSILVSGDDKEQGEYVCVNAAGVGFDAHISRLMQAAKTRGLTGYTNIVLRAYNNYQSSDYTLYINGRTIERNAWIIALQNSSRIGYGMPVAPRASIDDGIIDISIVDKIPLDHVAITAPLALTNHLQLSQHVEMFRTREVTIEGNVDRWVDVDGEGINIGRTVHFLNLPHSVKVYARDLNQLLIVRTPTGDPITLPRI
ncbi:MAG: hypothetical protein J6X79_02325 [Bacteroidales bacterium]|nr:hypothetical protein [Bacteroidales bacterium]